MKIIKIITVIFSTMLILSCSQSAQSDLTPLSSLCNSNQESLGLTPRTFLDGILTIHIPNNFYEMSQERIAMKYPDQQRPTVVMTNNDNGTVNVAINHTDHKVSPAEIEDFHRYMEGMFKKKYSSAVWYRSEVLQIGKRKCFVLDLQTPALDTKIRNIMMCTSVNGRILLVTFNTTLELESEWLDRGYCIISSIMINDQP